MPHTLSDSIKCLHVDLSDNFMSIFFTTLSHFDLPDMPNLNDELVNL